MLKEFKEFAMRGNVIDMAVGVIIGGAFGKIVTSLVNDILMPPIGLLISKVDFANISFNLNSRRFSSMAEAKAAGDAAINIGQFINSVIDFVIVAFVIFMMIHVVQRVRLKAFPAAPAPTPTATKTCPYCRSPVPLEAVRCPQCTSNIPIANG